MNKISYGKTMLQCFVGQLIKTLAYFVPIQMCMRYLVKYYRKFLCDMHKSYLKTFFKNAHCTASNKTENFEIALMV